MPGGVFWRILMENGNKEIQNKRYIPPRVLRKDTPGGTVWVPRWKWAGKLFGKTVPLPASPGPAVVGPVEGSPDGKSGVPAMDPQTVAVQPTPSSSEAVSTVEASKADPEPWGAWAYPLLGILSALVLAFAMGTGFGYVLAVGKPPSWLSGGALGAFVYAPSGAMLLLFAGLGCLVQGKDETGVRWPWQIAGITLLAGFLLVVFGGFL